ncbi:ribosomal RNA small subunit methyltransferase A [Candidatus Peregrinibacteria bacterium]|nr:ribosomal RNA small subunit methyltransferase A [Candidatus Peregrinibacteria bacterium]
MLLDELKTLLQSQNLWAKKGLGQNFLIDEKALNTIVSAADLQSSDNVIEVGPGTGFLTEQLIQKADRVTSVELDRDMVNILEKKFKFADNLKIINSDILNLRTKDYGLRTKQYKVVANIPYYITSPLLKHFLQSESRPTLMVVLVQKEVAEKVCGITGKSLITIETQLYGNPEIVDIVPSSSFYPAPKVESAILKISVFDKPLIASEKLKDFLRVVKFGFSQKRKMLANSLGAGIHMKPSEVRELIVKAGIKPDCRAEDLTIEDWEKLVKILTK